jgi:hypothetical protein
MLHGCLQAFRDLPYDLMTRLCKGMHTAHVPQHGILYEEDEPGDRMFVVVAGAATMRALPPADQRAPTSEPTLSGVVSTTAAGGPGAAPRRRRRVQLQPEEQVRRLIACCVFVTLQQTRCVTPISRRLTFVLLHA